MHTFIEFSNEDADQPDTTERVVIKRHKVKEQLNRIDTRNWEDFEDEDDDFGRFEKFKSRKMSA